MPELNEILIHKNPSIPYWSKSGFSWRTKHEFTYPSDADCIVFSTEDFDLQVWPK